MMSTPKKSVQNLIVFKVVGSFYKVNDLLRLGKDGEQNYFKPPGSHW